MNKDIESSLDQNNPSEVNHTYTSSLCFILIYKKIVIFYLQKILRMIRPFVLVNDPLNSCFIYF